jgi:hypothetical protein
VPQILQVSIIGFGNRPETVFSMLDEDSGVVMVSHAAAFTAKRRKGALVLTNDPGLEDRDALFVAGEDLGDAVTDFSEMEGAIKRLAYAPGLERCRPSLEKDGYDASGPKWRINPGITAAQFAVLVTCWHVRRVGQHVGEALSLMDELSAVLSGRVVTV